MITINDIERDEEKINGFAEELLRSLNENVSFAKIESVRLKDLDAMLKQLNRALAYYAKVEKTEHNIHFARGRLVGVSEMYQNLISLNESVEYYSHRVDDVFAAIKTVSHGDEILDCLSQSRGVQHKELSRVIEIDASTLTGIMDKLENLKLVYYTKVGKFKFYYLSELGQSYKDEKKAQPQIYIQELEVQLQKERERNKQLEIDYAYLKAKNEIKKFDYKIEYINLSLSDIQEINKINDKEIRKAQKVFDNWGKEKSLKLSNKCGATV